jgi:hypothetical protein
MAPKSAVEHMLVDQIIGALWRLRRLERAEAQYFVQRKKRLLTDALIDMSPEEYEVATRLIDDDELLRMAKPARDRRSEFDSVLKDLKSTDNDHDESNDNDDNDAVVKEKLASANDLAVIYLDGMSDTVDSFPFFVQRANNALVREIVRNHSILVRIQKQRSIKIVS